MTETKRPVSISLAAVLLILMAFNALQDLLGPGSMLASEWFSQASFRDLFNAAFRLVYVVSAALTAIALWEMKRWAMLCYAIWALITMLGRFIHDAILKVEGATRAPWWEIALGPILMGVLLAIIGLALRGSFRASGKMGGPD